MNILHKYKFEQGVAFSLVNSIVSDFLQLHQTTHPNYSNFDDYKKIAASDHLQDIYFEKTNPSYIEPLSLDKIQDIDGQFYDLKYSATPLFPILKRALKNQSLIDFLWEEQNLNVRHSQLSISSSLDASFSSRLKGQIKLEVYSDETQYSPSFTNKTQKFTCVYVSLADIPFHLRTKKDEIDIYMLVNYKKLKKLKLKDTNFALFNRLRSEIEEINRNGIKLCTSTGSYFTLNVTISSILGDNLAIYPLLGFSSSFHPSSYLCRFCLTNGRSRDGDDSIQELSVRRQIITNSDKGNQQLNRQSTFIFENFCKIDRWNVSPPDIVSLLFLITV